MGPHLRCCQQSYLGRRENGGRIGKFCAPCWPRGGSHRRALDTLPGLEEEGEEMQEEDDAHKQMQEGDEHISPPLLEDSECGEVEGQGEPDPEAQPGNETHSQGETEPEREPRRQSWEWVSIMDDKQPLTFDDPRSDSDCSTLGSTPLEPGLPEDVVEVHTPDSELQAL